MPSLIPAACVSTGPPKRTSTRGLFFSAITRASASPEENRTKFTLIPVAFSNSWNMGRAQFSGQIEYAFTVSAAAAIPGSNMAAISAKNPIQRRMVSPFSNSVGHITHQDGGKEQPLHVDYAMPPTFCNGGA